MDCGDLGTYWIISFISTTYV